MTTATTLPDLDECIELYWTAYDQWGTESFIPAQLDTNSSGTDYDRLLDLNVAYGLFTYDGSHYRVSCEPAVDAECWEAVISSRVNRIQKQISTQSDRSGSSSGSDLPKLTHEGQSYFSVFVAESETYDSVLDSVMEITDSQDRLSHGVVLRSPGEYANEIQQFADRLCDGSDVEDTSLPTHFQKEYSDVVGDDKNELEFRLYLSPA